MTVQNARHFEFNDETSSKFWEMSVSGIDVTVRYGKIGTVGQAQTKSFADEPAVVNYVDKMIAEKEAKGYVETEVKAKGDATRPVQPAVKKAGKKATSTALEPPKEYLEMQALWTDIRSALLNPKDPKKSETFLVEQYDTRIGSGSFGFEAIVKKVDPAELNRLGNVLRGPVYSCSGYEWPEAEGFPMVPVIQLDLDQCGPMGGVNLGDGLLQVFMPMAKSSGDDSFIRVIPRTAVFSAHLLDAPQFPKSIEAFTEISWATRDYDEDDEETAACQIVGFEKARFTMQRMDPLGDNLGPRELTSCGLSSQQIEAFDKPRALLSKNTKPGKFQLFGTFSVVQYEAEANSKPLFCFDSEKYGFNFGGGNAQVFYWFKEDGTPGFNFDWSCY